MFNPFALANVTRLLQGGFMLLFVGGGLLILGMVIGFFIGVVVTDSELGDMTREYFEMVQMQRDEVCDY